MIVVMFLAGGLAHLSHGHESRVTNLVDPES